MKQKIIIIASIILVLLSLLFYYNGKEVENQKQLESKEEEERKIEEKMKKNYGEKVRTEGKVNLFQKEEKKYKKIGTMNENIILSLEEQKDFDAKNPYFKIKDTNYYISYQDLMKTEETPSLRYQDYISFPIKITTKENTKFYQEEKEAFSLKESLTLDVIVKKEDSYGISYFNQLFFVKKEDVLKEEEMEVVEEVAEQIPVLNYHFIYLNGDTSCKEQICHSEDQINSHFSYFQENKVLTITTSELEQFIDDEIRLPKKSVLLTIDDGARAEKFIPFLEKYQVRATLFLVSSWYDKNTFSSPYMELASHTHDMHTTGVCPSGQGGGIRCLEEEKIQEDLKKSRETLNNTTAFCYPFYEYNDYAIEQVKKAGFTIAFVGGNRKVTHDTDKYKVPRYPIHSYHDVSYVKQIVES